MKQLFKPAQEGAALADDDTASARNMGWNALSGRMKLLIGVAVGSTVAGFAVYSNITPHHRVAIAQQADVHTPAQIKAYAPPEAPDLLSRATGTPTVSAAPQMVRKAAVPTEMELYSGGDRLGSSGGGSGAVRQASQTNRAGDTDDGIDTYKAVLVRNADYTIRAGERIPCLPIDAQDSSRPGFTTCRVPEWFRSSNERRGLLPPGTRIFGHIASGITNGQRRLGVVYTLIETPEFNMKLNGPAGDAMGRSGLDGDVHTFFWERFGDVALYALLDTAVGIGQDQATRALSNGFSGGGTTLDIGSNEQTLSQQEMEKDLQRPPILTRDQALPMTVTVGEDLDFSEACKLAMTVNPMACPLQ